MTRVDFYILKEPQSALFTCRLSEKIYQSGLRVYIHTADADSAKQLDQMLWTYQDQSFIPHAMVGTDSTTTEPVLLGHGAEPDTERDVLINLNPEVPTFFSRYERVAEIVANQEQAKQLGRSRYSFYRDRGYPIKTHQL